MSTPAGISGKGRAELTAVLRAASTFITPADVGSALHLDSASAAKRLARWAEDGWVRRVRRGLYIGVPVDAANPAAWSEDALAVASAVWSPCYFTGWTAANHWALTDQVFRTTVLKTAGRIRASKVTLLDHDYLVFHTSDASLAWGLKTEWRHEARTRFADPARTVIDILDDPKLGGGIRHGAEILAAYLDHDDPTTLVDYGDRLGNRTVFKRLGYLIETLDLHAPELTSASAARLPEGVSALDPNGPPGGRRAMRWRLRINVDIRPQHPA